MNAYISKPVHSAHLLSIIEEFAFPQNRARQRDLWVTWSVGVA